MRRLLRIAGLVVAGLTLLLILSLVAATAWLRSDGARALLKSRIEAATGRVVAFDNDLSVSVWPIAGVSLSNVRVSEAHRANQAFLSAKRITVGLRARPLLDKRVEVDALDVQGLELRMTRDTTGRFNFSDLLPEPSGRAPPAVTLDRVQLADGDIQFFDAATNLSARVTRLALSATAVGLGKAGNVALEGYVQTNQIAEPVRVTLATRLAIGTDAKSFALDELKLSAEGRHASTGPFTLALDAGVQIPSVAPLTVSVATPRLRTSFTAAELPLALDVSGAGANVSPERIAVDGLQAELRVTGNAARVAKFVMPSLTLVKGEASTPRLEAAMSWDGAQASVSTRAPLTIAFAGETLAATPLSLRAQGRNAEGAAIDGTLDGDVRYDAKARRLDFSRLSVQASALPHALGKPQAVSAAGEISARFAQDGLDARATLQGKLATSAYQLKAAAVADRYRLEGRVDRVDLDIWLASQPSAAKTSRAAKPANPLEALDLARWRALKLDADIAIGELRYDKTIARGVRVRVEP